ncbi:Uncharacterised protein [Achromobacter sp. 2789STDY5608633]|uniref:Uncharacterized protein n=2 Tax=Achromobacter TaxID=222 RepID=A0A6J5ABI7_9BURK|nr:hypothetical protein LMG26845_03268 [Achromobacter insuavis]CUI70322.1 Uncharacterised protein [Achromobacter sp. 2789STDY5608633]CUJ35771.1 Uncharacterised protein [Achromobacter sp. 2789STDY5608628]
MININKIKHLIPAFFYCSGVGERFSGDDWAIDYELDLDEEFNTEISNLQGGVSLLNDALQRNDLIAAKYALIEMRVASLSLYGFFMNIYDDVERVGWVGREGVVISKGCASFASCNGCEDVYFQVKNINNIKWLFLRLYDCSGGRRVFFSERGGVGCKADLDEKLSNDIADFQMSLNFLENSLREGDAIKVVVFLGKVRDSSLALSGFFKNIFDDIDKNAWSDAAKLPAIPEGYALPESYNYPKR